MALRFSQVKAYDAYNCQTQRNYNMADIQVRCINKTPRNNPHEGITHLGGDGWKLTRQEVINSINQKTNTFYTSVSGNRATVGVVNGDNGQYLRTYADGKWNDNLLALPECR
jgi:hypothetical protein